MVAKLCRLDPGSTCPPGPGRKFLPEELKAHKEKWLNICEQNPEILISANYEADVGPLQALIDELTFNEKVSLHRGTL